MNRDVLYIFSIYIVFIAISCSDSVNRKCGDNLMNVDWAIRFGGPDTDLVQDIATLPDGSTLITGSLNDDMTFSDGSPDRGESIPEGSFAICIRDNGSFAWSLNSGGTGDVEGYALDVFSDSHFYVFGRYWGSVTLGQGEVNETQLADSGSFVAKYDLKGELLWARRIGNLPAQSLAEEAISVADDGSFLIAGGYGSEVTLGPGEENETILTPYGSFDIFVARYDSNGELAWASKAGGETPLGDKLEADYGSDNVVLTDDTSIVTGCFFNSAIFGEGDPNETTLLTRSTKDDDIFLAKYNQDGSLAWAKSLGAGIDFFRIVGGDPRLIMTPEGSIYISSSFVDTARLGDSDPPETVLSSYGSESAFIAHYDNDGSFIWAIKIGESTRTMDISYMPDDTVLVTGLYQDSTTLGSGEPNETTFEIGDIYDVGDVFIANYNKEGQLLWARRAVGNAKEEGIGVESANDGNIVVAGHFQEAIRFCSAGDNEILLESDSFDVFVVRIRH